MKFQALEFKATQVETSLLLNQVNLAIPEDVAIEGISWESFD